MQPKPTKKKTPAASTAEVSSAQTQPLKEGIEPMNSIAVSKNEPASMSLVIADVTILQDEEGRYCLNDLQRVAITAGVVKNINPAEWMKLQQTQELIDLLINENPLIKPVNKTAGRYGGTFAVRELFLAYSMWISPSVNLKVIRAYDALAAFGKAINMSIGMSVNSWKGLVSLGRGMMKDLSSCADRGVAEGIYGTLLHVHRVCGIATQPLHTLAPGLRQELLDFEGGAA